MPKRDIELGATGQRVGPAVRRLREAAGLTLEQLADRLGTVGRPMLVSSLARLEVGQRRVDVDDLVALALALDASIGELLLPPTASSSTTVELTSEVSTTERSAWAWMTGDNALSTGRFNLDRSREFQRRAAPHRRKPGADVPMTVMDEFTAADHRAISKLIAAHGPDVMAATFDLIRTLTPITMKREQK